MLMIKQRKAHLYFHQPTGNIMYATKKESKRLGKDWHRVQFTTNDKGERVMRFQFKNEEGLMATVDVSEGEQIEVKDGQPVAN